MKFTQTEIKFCQDIAKKYRRKIKCGDFIIAEEDELQLGVYDEDNFVFKGDIFIVTQNLDLPLKYTSLWTLEDCLGFLRKRKYPVALAEDKSEGTCWLPWIDGKDKEFNGKTVLEACLKAILAVLEEGEK